MVLAHRPDGRTGYQGRTPMDTQGFVAGTPSIHSTPAPVTGTAGATGIAAIDGATGSDTGPVHHRPSPREILRSPGSQDGDASKTYTHLQDGNPTVVKIWLETYLHAHEGEVPFRHLPGEPGP
jgi:hypothetical protein